MSLNLSPGEPRFGLWCVDCAQPSGVETQYSDIQPDGVEPVMTLRICADCRGYRVLDNERES